jgi:tetratricopeptide (TPR) repeat protein
MTKKKHGRNTGNRQKPTGPPIARVLADPIDSDHPSSLASARRAAEKTMADMRRLLEEKDFSSIEEANEFIEGLMRSSGGQIPDVAPRTDGERAQNVMYEAWGTSSGKKRADLAKYALEISPDCADAYVLLAAETAKSLREKADLFERGVRAGERALGKEVFDEAAGGFWGLIETRPYMRARLGLASSLWGLAKRSAAIEHAREMLRLNPNDNQGVRDVLLDWLLTEGKHEEAGALLKRYEGSASADWLYGRALLAFRTGGRSTNTDMLLREAMEENPHVPAYLLGEKGPPEHGPELIEFGGESEAIEYADGAQGLWYFTPGALEWLRGVRGEVTATRVQPGRR